jgi:predicted CXXCH cytochrome family protein
LMTGTSHPVGVVPQMDVPPDLPLDKAGRVTCTTCHDTSQVGTARPEAAFGLRRSPGGGGLCQACHRAQPGSETRLSHAIMIGSAHGGGDSTTMSRTAFAPGIADSRSMQCMGCHDGSIAESDNMALTSGPTASGHTLGVTHPIGVDYAATAMARRAFQPASSLQRGAVRLVDGKVGCTSCHSPYSMHAKLLVMSNDRSGLCLSCHQL